MKTHVNSRPRARQVNSNKSGRSLVRRELKQLQRYQAQESKLLSLGQYALALVNLIDKTTHHLGQCFYKAETMAKMLGCSEKTIQRKEKALKGIGIETMHVIKRKGYKIVTIRRVNNFFDVGRLLSILSYRVKSIVTKFSRNVLRLSDDLYFRYEDQTTEPRFGTFGGGVPPDILDDQYPEHKNNLSVQELGEIF